MEYVWEPKPDSGLSGSVTIDIPSLKEQFKLLRDLSVKPKDGKMDLSDQLDIVEKQIDNCGKYIKAVKLVHTETKKAINSYEEMLMYKQTRELVIGEISGILVNGIDLGK